VAHDDQVIAACTKGHYAESIRVNGAHGDVTDTHVSWKATRRGAYVASTLCFEGCYYFAEKAGIGNCLRAATGEPVWRERLGGEYSASPVAGDGKVYFTNEDGVVTVVKAGPKFAVLAKNPIGERLIASPAISEGRIYLRGEKHLFCVGKK
jgi:outer membrane protein assembly factor BamB